MLCINEKCVIKWAFSQLFKAWKLTEVFVSNISLVKKQFHDEIRYGRLGFEEVGFITLQFEVQVVELHKNVRHVGKVGL